MYRFGISAYLLLSVSLFRPPGLFVLMALIGLAGPVFIKGKTERDIDAGCA